VIKSAVFSAIVIMMIVTTVVIPPLDWSPNRQR
jgi:hypothetical protein